MPAHSGARRAMSLGAVKAGPGVLDGRVQGRLSTILRDFGDDTVLNGITYRPQSANAWPAFSRSHAIRRIDGTDEFRFEARDGDTWSGDAAASPARNRAEMAQIGSTLPRSGSKISATDTFAIETDEVPLTGFLILNQLHSAIAGVNPIVSTSYSDGELKIVTTASAAATVDGTNQVETVRYVDAAFPRRKYARFVYEATPGTGSGALKVWRDGALIVDLVNIDLGFPDDPRCVPYFKWGLYRRFTTQSFAVRHVNVEGATLSDLSARILTPKALPGGIDLAVPNVPAAPNTAALYGLVSKTADGSVGQTYTGPAWSSPQWHRETLASPKTRTAIAGATARTYVATADDVGFRLVMGGTDAGVPKFAAAFADVRIAPIVLESFDTSTSLSVTTAGNPALSVDASEKVQGAASIVAEGQGAGNRLMRTLGPLTGIAGVGSLAGLGTVAYMREELKPYTMGATSGSVRLDQTSGTPSASGLFDGGVVTNSHKGRFWNSFRPDQNGYLQGKDPALSWKLAFDRSSSSSAPHAQKTRYDALLARAEGRTAVVLGFDDAYLTQHSTALPLLVARGLAATFYLPSQIVTDAGSSGRMNWDRARELFAAGMDLQCDGTPDDTAMLNHSTNPAAALAALKAVRARIMDEVPGTDPRHFCYPNGQTDTCTAVSPGIVDHRTYSGAVTAAGTGVLTGLTSTSGLAVGMLMGGFGVPDETRIVSVDSATQVTVGKNVPSTTVLAAFWDDSHPFFLDKLQDAIRTDGTFYTGRTTTFDSFHSRFGFGGGRAMFLPACSTSNGSTGNASDAQLATAALARVDAAVTKGDNIEFYLHSVMDGATFIHTPTSTFAAILDGLVARRDAGQIDILTKAQLWARDGGSSVPV